MTSRIATTAMKKLLALALALSPLPLVAAAGGAAVETAHTNIANPASLQRGARLYMNYCSGCHSLEYLRYSRVAEDLGLTEEQAMRNLNFTGAKFGEPIRAAMPAADAEQWFGKAPPDLSLVARSRGVDWVYTYLKSFYIDESKATGWNNPLLPGVSMPNVLWELQGVQRAAFEPGEKGGEPRIKALTVAEHERGSMSAAEFDEAVRDLTAFLQYAGEPAALQRSAVGVWVILFLALLTFLAWLVKHEYWKDVH
jgi:ubiquinol-cytochrome c reductase cytochrome c1 subunit